MKSTLILLATALGATACSAEKAAHDHSQPLAQSQYSARYMKPGQAPVLIHAPIAQGQAGTPQSVSFTLKPLTRLDSVTLTLTSEAPLQGQTEFAFGALNTAQSIPLNVIVVPQTGRNIVSVRIKTVTTNSNGISGINESMSAIIIDTQALQTSGTPMVTENGTGRIVNDLPE